MEDWSDQDYVKPSLGGNVRSEPAVDGHVGRSQSSAPALRRPGWRPRPEGMTGPHDQNPVHRGPAIHARAWFAGLVWWPSAAGHDDRVASRSTPVTTWEEAR